MSRPAALALLLVRRSPVRSILISLLVAMAIVVLALVSELSRVSQEGLDSAIIRDSGLTGSYEIVLPPESGMDADEGYALVTDVADQLDVQIWGYWEELPSVESECPPYEQVGSQVLRVLWESPGTPSSLPFGELAGMDAEWCIDGQSIPADALYLADDDHKAVYGSRLYVRNDYQNLVLLSTLGAETRGYTVVAGTREDLAEDIRALVKANLATASTVNGTDIAASVTVRRLDQDSSNVREAADGLSTTYNVIGWGVVALAAVALLGIQASHTRQRLWFYGLLRSQGARARTIAILMLTDAVIVIAAGAALALVTLALSSSAISTFARMSFGVEANVLSPELLPRIALGGLLLLACSTLAPLAMTLRRDPLEVLEAPRD